MTTESRLRYFEGLSEYEFQDTKYKIVEYDKLSSDLFERCIFIDKKSLDTLFPKVGMFKGRVDFNTYKFKL